MAPFDVGLSGLCSGVDRTDGDYLGSYEWKVILRRGPSPLPCSFHLPVSLVSFIWSEIVSYSLLLPYRDSDHYPRPDDEDQPKVQRSVSPLPWQAIDPGARERR